MIDTLSLTRRALARRPLPEGEAKTNPSPTALSRGDLSQMERRKTNPSPRGRGAGVRERAFYDRFPRSIDTPICFTPEIGASLATRTLTQGAPNSLVMI